MSVESSAAGKSSPEIWIGLDTGGTYTDAVALDGRRRVIASAKALTTHWDLSLGLAEALRAVLAGLSRRAREHVSLVSVSTTLAMEVRRESSIGGCALTETCSTTAGS